MGSRKRTDKHRATVRAWNAAHKEQVRANCLAWRTRNRDRYLALSREARARRNARNPEKARAYRHTANQTRYARFCALLSWLREAPCQDCGQCYHSACMDFDHTRGIKNFDIGAGYSKPKPAFLEELTKCDLVCKNCHGLRTYRRRIAEKHSK